MKKYTILNLGAGVQSSWIYALMVEKEIPWADFALFADTQTEPPWVYEQLAFLRGLSGPPIVTVTAGNLGADLLRGENATKQRFVTIPAHTTSKVGQPQGLLRRQCTQSYKITPVARWIRTELLRLKPKHRVPAGIEIHQLFGFSVDEPQRAVRMRVNFDRQPKAWTCGFPLLAEEILATRLDCQMGIEEYSGVKPWRSSRCVCCPLQGNRHWREIKANAVAWNRATEIDHALRRAGNIVQRNLDQAMFLHRHCVPLEQATLDAGQGVLFQDDYACEDGCFL